MENKMILALVAHVKMAALAQKQVERPSPVNVLTDMAEKLVQKKMIPALVHHVKMEQHVQRRVEQPSPVNVLLDTVDLTAVLQPVYVLNLLVKMVVHVCPTVPMTMTASVLQTMTMEKIVLRTKIRVRHHRVVMVANVIAYLHRIFHALA